MRKGNSFLLDHPGSVLAAVNETDETVELVLVVSTVGGDLLRDLSWIFNRRPTVNMIRRTIKLIMATMMTTILIRFVRYAVT